MLEKAIKFIKENKPKLLETLLEEKPELVKEFHVFSTTYESLLKEDDLFLHYVENSVHTDYCKTLLAYAIEERKVDCIKIILKRLPDLKLVSWANEKHCIAKYNDRDFEDGQLISSTDVSKSNEKTCLDLMKDKSREMKKIFFEHISYQPIIDNKFAKQFLYAYDDYVKEHDFRDKKALGEILENFKEIFVSDENLKTIYSRLEEMFNLLPDTHPKSKRKLSFSENETTYPSKVLRVDLSTKTREKEEISTAQEAFLEDLPLLEQANREVVQAVNDKLLHRGIEASLQQSSSAPVYSSPLSNPVVPTTTTTTLTTTNTATKITYSFPTPY